jgi:hypothetical protein
MMEHQIQVCCQRIYEWETSLSPHVERVLAFDPSLRWLNDDPFVYLNSAVSSCAPVHTTLITVLLYHIYQHATFVCCEHTKDSWVICDCGVQGTLQLDMFRKEQILQPPSQLLKHIDERSNVPLQNRHKPEYNDVVDLFLCAKFIQQVSHNALHPWFIQLSLSHFTSLYHQQLNDWNAKVQPFSLHVCHWTFDLFNKHSSWQNCLYCTQLDSHS